MSSFDDPLHDLKQALDAADVAGQLRRMVDAASAAATLAASVPSAAEIAAMKTVMAANIPSPAEVAVMKTAIAASLPSPEEVAIINDAVQGAAQIGAHLAEQVAAWHGVLLETGSVAEAILSSPEAASVVFVSNAEAEYLASIEATAARVAMATAAAVPPIPQAVFDLPRHRPLPEVPPMISKKRKIGF
jgi:hypothetical protein